MCQASHARVASRPVESWEAAAARPDSHRSYRRPWVSWQPWHKKPLTEGQFVVANLRRSSWVFRVSEFLLRQLSIECDAPGASCTYCKHKSGYCLEPRCTYICCGHFHMQGVGFAAFLLHFKGQKMSRKLGHYTLTSFVATELIGEVLLSLSSPPATSNKSA